MISNLDIERIKNTQNKNHNKEISNRINILAEYDSRTLKSRKFSRFMERLLRAYAKGKNGLELPLFMPKNFPNLVVSKFNSYDLQSTLVYDFLNKYVFFRQRY